MPQHLSQHTQFHLIPSNTFSFYTTHQHTFTHTQHNTTTPSTNQINCWSMAIIAMMKYFLSSCFLCLQNSPPDDVIHWMVGFQLLIAWGQQMPRHVFSSLVMELVCKCHFLDDVVVEVDDDDSDDDDVNDDLLFRPNQFINHNLIWNDIPQCFHRQSLIDKGCRSVYKGISTFQHSIKSQNWFELQIYLILK